MNWFDKFLFKRSEIIETDKSYEEIMSALIKHTEERKLFQFDFHSSSVFRKIEVNTVYISSIKMSFWPSIELELYKYANPRLKVIYNMFWRSLIPYAVLSVIFVASLFNINTYFDFFFSLFLALALFLIPVYVNKLKRNFVEWLRFIL